MTVPIIVGVVAAIFTFGLRWGLGWPWGYSLLLGVNSIFAVLGGLVLVGVYK